MLRLLETLPKLRALPAQRLRWRLLHWLLACAVFFVVVGALLLAGALYLFAAQTLTPWQSLAVTGVITAAVAITCIVRLDTSVRSPTRATSTDTDALNEMIMGRLDEATASLGKHSNEMVLLGLAAGVLLGFLSDQHKHSQ